MDRADLIGQTLGQYHIEAELCVGGMGQVFRGVHMYLGRPAAVKVMHAHLATEASFREHFFLEAQAIAALKHENIVSIYDFGEQDGLLYLVMELMTDGSLRNLLPQHQELPLALKLDLICQAADGLAAAHEQGFIHCDIKPDNLLLTRLRDRTAPYEAYRLKISDFGLVHFALDDRADYTDLPVGTIAYMSPEQYTRQKVNPQSDLYALGIVLYELVCGARPFQLNEMHDKQSERTNEERILLQGINLGIADDLEEIISRCLARDPDKRYTRARDLASDLRRIIGKMQLEGMTLPQPVSRVEVETSEANVLAGDNSQSIQLYNEDQHIVQESNNHTYATQDIQNSDLAPDCTRIGIVVDQKTLSIMPGQRTTTEITIINLGNITDRFAMSVEGFESSWIEGLETELDMKPGTQKTIELAINVDRAAENLAQIHTVLIRVRSHEEPAESGSMQVHWEILPFYEAFMAIESFRSKTCREAHYNVIIGNTGNAPIQYVLSGEDEERQLYYKFDEPIVSLEPEEESRIKLLVRSQRFWPGNRASQPFRIAAIPLGDWIPLDSKADLISQPILPQWFFAAVGVVLIVCSLFLAVGLRRHLSENGKIAFLTDSIATAAVPTTPIGGVPGDATSRGAGVGTSVAGGTEAIPSGSREKAGTASTNGGGVPGTYIAGKVGAVGSPLPSAAVTPGLVTAGPTVTPGAGAGSLPAGSGVGTGSGSNWGIGVGVPTDVPGCGGTATPGPQSTATTVNTDYTSPTLYLHAGGQLDNTGGSLAKASVIASAEGKQNIDIPMKTTVYTATGITGTYDKSARTMFNLYVDQGTAIGSGIQVRIIFDFNGDGRSLGIETYHYFALDSKPGWERETQDSFHGLEPPAPTFADLHNGKVTVEVWNAIGNNNTELSTDAPFVSSVQSSITIPYTF